MSADETSLRAEHDALAERLRARISVDHWRRAAYAGLFGFIALGLAVKLAWDRWFSTRPARFTGPPVFFLAAAAVGAALAFFAAREIARARRIGRVEDADFARLRDLRARLGLDG